MNIALKTLDNSGLVHEVWGWLNRNYSNLFGEDNWMNGKEEVLGDRCVHMDSCAFPCMGQLRCGKPSL
jgi:hypothetical protein